MSRPCDHFSTAESEKGAGGSGLFLFFFFFFYFFATYRKGDIWKKTRSFAAKQIIPRRVGNFVNPLCEVADEFLEHLESLMDDSGTVADVAPEINKWAFQGQCEK